MAQPQVYIPPRHRHLLPQTVAPPPLPATPAACRAGEIHRLFHRVLDLRETMGKARRQLTAYEDELAAHEARLANPVPTDHEGYLQLAAAREAVLVLTKHRALLTREIGHLDDDLKHADGRLEAAWQSYIPLKSWLENQPGPRPKGGGEVDLTDDEIEARLEEFVGGPLVWPEEDEHSTR